MFIQTDEFISRNTKKIMDSEQIKNIFMKMCRGNKVEWDCIHCDFLKTYTIQKYPVALCVNDEEYGKPGAHWIGLYIERQGRPVEFFCSFGRSMLTYPKYFNDFAVRYKLRYNQAPFDLQGLDSSFCGHHVLYFFYNRLKGVPFTSFYISYKKQSPYQNDEKVRKFIDIVAKSRSLMRL